MKRSYGHFELNDTKTFRKCLIRYAERFSNSAVLDSNNYSKDDYTCYDLVAGLGAVEVCEPGNNCFSTLEKQLQETPDWYFGSFCYDLKNEVEQLTTSGIDALQFPLIHFFRPTTVLLLKGDRLEIQSYSETKPPEILGEILDHQEDTDSPLPLNKIELSCNMTKPQYLQKVEQVKNWIVAGEIYELNLCQQWYSEKAQVNAASLFNELNELAAAPFSAFLKIADRYALCSSPERFLQKKEDRLIAQPIKGTAPRGNTPEEDAMLRNRLLNSEKDRAENVMIVDLMRNDLAKSSETGTVSVKELCSVYSFNSVHQMISTIRSIKKEDVGIVEAIKNAFPMGSMTGAPKFRAMQLIDVLEPSARGLYSGSIGYFTPEGDFDLNVVIRTILYDASSHHLSFHTGGAITYDSVAEKEYEECLVKASGLLNALGHSNI